MIRRVPVIPTIIVAAAVATMIGLGIWQLRRAGEKDRLIARYAAAANQPPISWPGNMPPDAQLPLFRHATGMCAKVIGKRVVAGESRAGEPGYAQIVECAPSTAGPGMSVEIGWSKNPNAEARWSGGPVSGIIAPDRKTGMRLIAASAPPGLEPSRPPSLDAIPNNHKSYAVQWFSFAAIALIIYALAVRKRFREQEPNP